MRYREELLRRVVRRLIMEDVGVEHEENRDEVTHAENRDGEAELRGDGRVQVELLSHDEAAVFQFPVWFQRLLTSDGTADLVAFNKLMNDVFNELGRLQHGDVVVQMIQSKDHREFLTLYCSLMREINPLMEVDAIVDIVKELMHIWLQNKDNEKIWLCLTQQIDQSTPIQPTPVKQCLGKEARLLPRYGSDDLKQAVEMGVSVLKLNELQGRQLQKNYLKLTTVMNELYRVKNGQVEIRHALDVLKFLLKEYLTEQQLNIKDASGAAQSLSQGQAALIPLGDGEELVDDNQILQIIQTYKLGNNLNDEETKIIGEFHDNMMKKLPNLQKLYNYIKSPNQDITEDISASYQDIKESLKGFLQEQDFATDILNTKMKAFVKYLMIIVMAVEDKYDSAKQNVAAINQSRGGGGKDGAQISTDTSLGENSIHADAEILDEYVSGVNLLQQENFDKSHVNLKLLNQDADFNALYPQSIYTLQLWSKKLSTLPGQKRNELMTKYVALISKTYKNYLNLLKKLGEDGVFFAKEYYEGTKNDTPKFLYQLLYLYEKFVKLMPENEIQKFGDEQKDTSTETEKTEKLLDDFDMKKFSENFVLNNADEMEEYVRDIPPDPEFKKYEKIMQERHPDFIKLSKAVNRMEDLKRGQADEENTSGSFLDNNYIPFITDSEEVKKHEKEKRKIGKERLKQYGVESKRSFFKGYKNYEGDWELAMFTIFKESVLSYLSVLKKVRAGAFDNVRRYGNVVKPWVYYYLYQWEKHIKDLDIEEMIDDASPGLFNKALDVISKPINSITNYIVPKSEEKTPAEEANDESQKLATLINQLENNNETNFKKIFEKIYNSNEEIAFNFGEKDILNNDFIVNHLDKYVELSNKINKEYNDLDLDYDLDEDGDEDADEIAERNKDLITYKQKLIKKIYESIDEISNKITVTRKEIRVEKERFVEILKSKIKALILNDKTALEDFENVKADIKARKETEKNAQIKTKEYEERRNQKQADIDEIIKDLEDSSENDDTFADIFEKIYGTENASFKDKKVREMINKHVMLYRNELKDEYDNDYKNYFIKKTEELIDKLVGKKYQSTLANLSSNKMSQKEFGRRLKQLINNFGHNSDNILMIKNQTDDNMNMEREKNDFTDGINLGEMMSGNISDLDLNDEDNDDKDQGQ